MKNMKVLIDTNIFLDWLQEREPFKEKSEIVLWKCLFGEIEGFVTPHSLNDLFYILRKDYSVEERKHYLGILCRHLTIILEDKTVITNVLSNEALRDFEDGLQIVCAHLKGLDYIITRDKSDFKNSPVPAIAPDKFLELFSSEEKLN